VACRQLGFSATGEQVYSCLWHVSYSCANALLQVLLL
jgi:hypothetical protein